jgi:transcription initiation factor TFIID subunit 2
VFYFREPVNPVELGIPDYHKVIPKKDARDLRTIKTKLDTDKYDSVDAFETDVQLMVDNAIKFNGYGSDVAKKAELLLERVKDMLQPIRQGVLKKRKDDNDSEGPSTKKQKT